VRMGDDNPCDIVGVGSVQIKAHDDMNPWGNATMVYSCTCEFSCDHQDYHTVISSVIARNTQTINEVKNTNNRLTSPRCFPAHEAACNDSDFR
jgi:hypothetical protein